MRRRSFIQGLGALLLPYEPKRVYSFASPTIETFTMADVLAARTKLMAWNVESVDGFYRVACILPRPLDYVVLDV